MEPNTTLRAVRLAMSLSQDELAALVREAGQSIGQPNDCGKRHVQRWEAGTIGMPRPAMARALEAATRRPIATLGFRVPVPGESGGDATALPGVDPTTVQPVMAGAVAQYGGVWVSRYEYPSSSRGGVYSAAHHVVIVQSGNHLSVRSLPKTANGELAMELYVEGSVVTGTWTEVTAVDGYYRGARYHGTIQMVVDPTGRRMAGKWIGFGRDMDINDGPWTLSLVDASTAAHVLKAWDRPVED